MEIKMSAYRTHKTENLENEKILEKNCQNKGLGVFQEVKLKDDKRITL